MSNSSWKSLIESFSKNLDNPTPAARGGSKPMIRESNGVCPVCKKEPCECPAEEARSAKQLLQQLVRNAAEVKEVNADDTKAKGKITCGGDIVDATCDITGDRCVIKIGNHQVVSAKCDEVDEKHARQVMDYLDDCNEKYAKQVAKEWRRFLTAGSTVAENYSHGGDNLYGAYGMLETILAGAGITAQITGDEQDTFATAQTSDGREVIVSVDNNMCSLMTLDPETGEQHSIVDNASCDQVDFGALGNKLKKVVMVVESMYPMQPKAPGRDDYYFLLPSLPRGVPGAWVQIAEGSTPHGRQDEAAILNTAQNSAGLYNYDNETFVATAFPGSGNDTMGVKAYSWSFPSNFTETQPGERGQIVQMIEQSLRSAGFTKNSRLYVPQYDKYARLGIY